MKVLAALALLLAGCELQPLLEVDVCRCDCEAPETAPRECGSPSL